MAVVEVKQPGSGEVSDLKVLGEVFDYITQLRNSYGHCEVFGIITTMEEWRLCWFPGIVLYSLCNIFWVML